MAFKRSSAWRRPTRQLSTWASVAATLGSVISGSIGAVAIFMTDNEVGTAAAWASGIFFAVVALTGQVPRVKVGDNEIDPRSYALGAVGGAEAAAGAAGEAAATSADPDDVVAAAEQIARRLKSINLQPGPDDLWNNLTVTDGTLVDYLKQSPGFAQYLADRAEETNMEIRWQDDQRRRAHGASADHPADPGANAPKPENPSSV
ncbi:hypothetical protein E0H75_42370 [Kribbella capetownensis]|uniref:Uncharacterized protein n=1 Tax=Kribbella capetownensis TaxID=1572659 RepID=A0A4V2M3Z2_9ACTN|nr:hypothetical protein [Kribbella capetownensis]TCC33902.1 hypothetical protein E0H75_42370 [Kribbella capetownensis]